MKKTDFLKGILYVCMAAAIPALLILTGTQSRKYTDLEREIEHLKEKTAELVEENNKLSNEIYAKLSSDTVESVAENELGMHKADKSEIVRVNIKNGDK